MKETLMEITVALIMVCMFIYAYFGAILQESYKLYPRTYEEMTEHVHVHER